MSIARSRRPARAGYIARMPFRRSWSAAKPRVLALIALVGIMACMDSDTTQKVAQAFQASTSMPDEVPKMINTELPFRYPAALYARRVQGNVTLRLHVDRDGQVRADSTRIEESSGYPALDSAAIQGSQELRFVPAKLHGEPMAVTILFPVYFRHPDAHPLPGDTILTRRDSAPTEAP
jgi:TonB family protein